MHKRMPPGKCFYRGDRVKSDLAVCDGFIAGVGDYEGRKTLRADGMFVSPGFIDGHNHIESSLLSPANYCAAVLPWGTSAVVADPHEIANVLGLPGIRYFAECARNVRTRYFSQSAELCAGLPPRDLRGKLKGRRPPVPAARRKSARPCGNDELSGSDSAPTPRLPTNSFFFRSR